MGDYTIKALSDIRDVLGDYPGEMRFATYDIDAEQAALTWRRMPPKTGGKGSYGHRHKTQEEIYLVVSGTLQFKLVRRRRRRARRHRRPGRATRRALGVERRAGRRRARDRVAEDR